MDRVFNMGIGLVMVVAEYYADSIVRHLTHKVGVPTWIIGAESFAGEKTVTWELDMGNRAGSGRDRFRRGLGSARTKT